MMVKDKVNGEEAPVNITTKQRMVSSCAGAMITSLFGTGNVSTVVRQQLNA